MDEQFNSTAIIGQAAAIAETRDSDTAIQKTLSRTDHDVDAGSVASTIHDPEKGLPEITETTQIDTSEKDPNVDDWDGPDDPEKPINWPRRKKWINVFIISALSLLTPWGSSNFATSVPQMMEDFHQNSTTLATFVVSVWVLGYAFGPLFIAPLSELYGRLPVYHTNTVLFIIFNIACGLSTNLSMLIVFRFLAGVAGCCAITVGSGTIADLFKQEERGKVMSIWTFPVLFGPTLGPLVSAYLGQAAGWRWDFWLLVIITGVVFIIALIFQNETYAIVLLQRKVKALRKSTGNQELRAATHSNKTTSQLLKLSALRPLKMLFLSPIIFLLSLYIALTYGMLYLLFTTMTEVFEGQYNFGQGTVGLTFLGIGVGQFVGLFSFGALSDKMLKKWAKGGAMKPEYRLPLLLPGAVLLPIGLLIYGWSANYAQHVHWFVPILGTAMVGAGGIGVFMPVGTYLVDAFTVYAASAMAANTVLRSFGGALLPLCGRAMYQALGLGWGNSLLAFVALALVPPMLFLIKYGETLRTHPRFQLNL